MIRKRLQRAEWEERTQAADGHYIAGRRGVQMELEDEAQDSSHFWEAEEL
jgi:hypothetical protein